MFHRTARVYSRDADRGHVQQSTLVDECSEASRTVLGELPLESECCRDVPGLRGALPDVLVELSKVGSKSPKPKLVPTRCEKHCGTILIQVTSTLSAEGAVPGAEFSC